MTSVISRLELSPEASFGTLSAGLKRRTMLGRALVRKPDILLLDEPTNHLDMDSIGWMEEFLSRFEGSILFVTHDRMFLRRLATRIVELDRGRLTSWPGDYDDYLRLKAAELAAGESQREAFDKKLGAGGKLDPAGGQGAAHAQRGPRADAGTNAPEAARAQGTPGNGADER